jgi:4Fe-4S dicluster domain
MMGAELLIDVPLSEIAIGVAAGAVGLVLFLLALCALPFGDRGGVRVVGPPERVDERDALFHRFYRLEPGTPEFAAYYEQHPEHEALDAEIRALPGLARPGSRSYDPFASPAMLVSFELSERLARSLCWEPEPLGDGPVVASPGELAGRVKGFARYLGADMVGCTRLDSAHIYSHVARGQGAWGAPIDLDHENAVALAVRMDQPMTRHAPRLASTVETARRYLDTTIIAQALARYITLLGYQARAHVDTDYQLMCVPVAAAAGLGELGRLGLLITPRFGPRVRLAVVSTNMPLAPDAPMAFGVQHFCEICKKCATCCPSDAIAAGEREVVRGVEKWQSAQERCYHYWRRCGTDCGVCLKVCPYAHPTSPFHDLVRWFVRRNPLSRRLALWGDDLAYGRRPSRSYPLPPWLEPGDL